MFFGAFFCLLYTLLVSNALAGAPTILRTQVVFENTTRFPYNHMTTMVQLEGKKLLMAWQASHVGEGHADQRIVMCRSENGGTTWTDPVDVIRGDNVPVWGPVMILAPSEHKKGALFLYFSRSVPQNIRFPGSDRHFPGGDILLVKSHDEGETWSEPEMILPFVSPSRGNISKMTANRPVFLNQAKTEWALPFWQEAHDSKDTGPHSAGVIVTTDGGKTHKPFGNIVMNSTWLIENSVAPLSPLPARRGFGNFSLVLLQYFRTKIGFIYQSTSTDGGRTWSDAVPTTIPNPDSKAYLVASLDSTGTPQEWVLSCNPQAHGRGELAAMRTSQWSPKDYKSVLLTENEVLLRNTTTYKWDYPTVVPLLKKYNQLGEDHLYAVTYSGFSHRAAMITWISTKN